MYFEIISINCLIDFIQKYYFISNNSFKLFYEYNNVILSLNNDNIILGLYDNDTDKNLIGTIVTTKIPFVINDVIIDMGEVNYLCLHPNHRSLGMAKFLIDGITKKCDDINLSIGFFSGSNKYNMYNCFATLYYYHRPINIKKLYELNFLKINNNINNDINNDINIIQNYYDTFDPIYLLKHKYVKINVNKFNNDLLNIVFNLYNNHINKHKYKFYQLYTIDNFADIIKNPIVDSYLIYDNDIVIDFVILYNLKQKSMVTGDFIFSSYIFLYTDNIVSIKNIFSHLLCILYYNKNIDILSFLNIMDLQSIIDDPIFKIDPSLSPLYYNTFVVNNNMGQINTNNINPSDIYKMIF